MMKNLNGNIDIAERDLLINKLVLLSLHTQKPIDVFVSVSPHVEQVSVYINVNASYSKDGNINNIFSSSASYSDGDKELRSLLNKSRSIIKSHANKEVPLSIKGAA